MLGRKSKRLINETKYKGLWRAAVYCRLSSDDGDNAESDSIKNQRELINYYLNNENNIQVVDYYIDDGYSGTSFNRPAFKRMIKDMYNEKINLIIVKDLSRFGRNYLEAGMYLEQTFPLYNVRFIAINDNVDSYKDPKSINNVIVPFKNLLNDEYAKDISMKVRCVYKTKARNGEFVGGTTPYGYKKNPNNKYQLIIDEEEAPNIRLIFSKYIAGDGQIKICKYLNDNKILCRKEIQRRKKRGLSLNPNDDEICYKWSRSTIEKILTNETYIGNVVQNKTTTVSYKNHKVVYLPKEEWTVVKNTHEAIIGKDDFEKVQAILNSRNQNKKEPTGLTIYYGKIKCADCGGGMCKMEDDRGKNFLSHYYCRNYKTTSSNCSPHKIKTSELNHIVKETIMMQVKLVFELERALNKMNEDGLINNIEQQFNANLNKFINDIDKNKKLKKKAYEDWKLENITKEEYLDYAKECEDRIVNLNREIEVLQNTYNENIKNMKKDNYWIEHFKRNNKIKELTREVINELVDKIYIHEGGNVTIRFKYQDEYQKALEYIKSKEEC